MDEGPGLLASPWFWGLLVLQVFVYAALLAPLLGA